MGRDGTVALQSASENGRQAIGSLRGLQLALLVFGFGLAGLILGLVGYGLWLGHDRAIATAGNQIASLACVFEQHAGQTIVVVDRALTATAAILGSGTGTEPPFADPVTAQLQQLLGGAPQMLAISGLDRSGSGVHDPRVAVSTGGPSIERHECAQHLDDTGTALHVFLSHAGPGGQSYFAISRRLSDENDVFTGVVVAF